MSSVTHKKIVVTGGAGFLGSHLCDELLKNPNNKVFAVDNLFTGSRDNIKHLDSNENFQFIYQDITHPVHPLFLDEKIHEIYNLACPASPIHYQRNPVKTIKTNVVGSANMLEFAENQGAKIFQASTSEIYGDPEIHPQPEHYRGSVNTIGPRACYDEGKRAAETLFFDYHREKKLDIRVARIFNTYGPRMARDDGRVVSNFIMQALENKDITIFGSGEQTRSFCYVSDLVQGMIDFMNQDQIIGPMNLGNPAEFTILELAQKVIQLTKSKSKIAYQELPTDDPKIRKPDISLAKETVGFDPRVQLTEGLKNTINYFQWKYN